MLPHALLPVVFHEILKKLFCPHLTDEKTESIYLTYVKSQAWKSRIWVQAASPTALMCITQLRNTSSSEWRKRCEQKERRPEKQTEGNLNKATREPLSIFNSQQQVKRSVLGRLAW